MKETNCIFCMLVNGQLPVYKVWENEQFIAFLDRFPEVEGMTVLATKEHLSSYFKSTPDELLTQMMAAAKVVSDLIDTKLEGVTRTKLVFEGMDVDHLHLKLYPMRKDKLQISEKLDVTDEDLIRVQERLTA